MPYFEWQHSDYRGKPTCQLCHMPAVSEPVAVASLLGKPGDGVRLHTFTGGNFLLEGMLVRMAKISPPPRNPPILPLPPRASVAFESQSARVTLGPAEPFRQRSFFAVRVEISPPRAAHGLYLRRASSCRGLRRRQPRRPRVRQAHSRRLIAGNANDSDPTLFAARPRITQPDQVQIFEPILGDSQGRVTTGLLSATQYLKDNRILPAGFDKSTAPPDIAVKGDAAADADFAAGSSTTHYDVSTNSATGPFRITAELIYQPIGYRWAHNLASYQAAEPQQFVRDYDQAAAHSAVVLAHAEATVTASF